MKITKKINEYLNLNEAGSKLYPIPKAEVVELIYDWATGSKKHSETFDTWDDAKDKMKPKKEIAKTDSQVTEIIQGLEKAMKNPENILKMVKATTDEYINKNKNKNDVTKALYDFMRNKTFRSQMEEYFIEMYR